MLWSSPKDVRGADMGNATLGSPTLAFSLQANGAELAINNLKTPISLKLVTRTLTPTLARTLTRILAPAPALTLSLALTLTLTLPR